MRWVHMRGGPLRDTWRAAQFRPFIPHDHVVVWELSKWGTWGTWYGVGFELGVGELG